MTDDDEVLDLVKRRLSTDPSFRHELTELLRDFGQGGASIEAYLDQTLTSPRLRALFEQSRGNSKGR